MFRTWALSSLAIVCLAGCNDMKTSSTGSGAGSGAHTDRDNTAVNVRDRADEAKTPIDQNENKTDVDITAEIRRRVIDADLSMNADNVKIITQDRRVTLRGPVKTAAEKSQIEQMAAAVAGAGNVDSQLEVEASP